MCRLVVLDHHQRARRIAYALQRRATADFALALGTAIGHLETTMSDTTVPSAAVELARERRLALRAALREVAEAGAGSAEERLAALQRHFSALLRTAAATDAELAASRGRDDAAARLSQQRVQHAKRQSWCCNPRARTRAAPAPPANDAS